MRRVIIVLLVLVGLFVAADFGAAALAESVVSRQMRQQIGLRDDPSVRINGFPFLTQALTGRYGSVDVQANNITVAELEDLSVQAQLRDVDAPLSTVLGSGPKTLKVGEAEGSVRIPARDVEQLLNRNGAITLDDLRIDPVDEAGLKAAAEESDDTSLTSIDPDLAVRLTATTVLPLLGENEVSVIAQLSLDNGKARIVPRDVRFGGNALPTAVQRVVAEVFTVTVDPGSLPLQVTPTELTAESGALRVSGTARNLTIGGASTE
ncbi:Protein of unknown function [Pseudonocardia thermophila]|uniref:DUF2993 domain-containing protein n=1 Tax=Pseudonocardia thermophila TaxID=1848 RepID=A0A1M6SB65_PSETH|nr:Protein of unknown function [Pseudonocardia thermophila]